MRKLTQINMAVIMILAAQASAAYELIMVEQQGCHYCERWKEEIGPIYPKTDVGMFAPIRMVDITNVDSTPEIAAAVVFLASDEASYITGATLHINGGMAML